MEYGIFLLDDGSCDGAHENLAFELLASSQEVAYSLKFSKDLCFIEVSSLDDPLVELSKSKDTSKGEESCRYQS